MTERVGELSELQKRCLLYVAANMSSKEIAIEVGLSPQTVDQYVSRAITTLGVMNRREAARMLLARQESGEFRKSEFRSEDLVGPAIPPEVEPSQDITESEGQPLAPRAMRWILQRFGGAPHDLDKMQTLRAIIWTALFAAGALASIVTTGAWLGYRAP